jgi:hypothetical protein
MLNERQTRIIKVMKDETESLWYLCSFIHPLQINFIFFISPTIWCKRWSNFYGSVSGKIVIFFEFFYTGNTLGFTSLRLYA